MRTTNNIINLGTIDFNKLSEEQKPVLLSRLNVLAVGISLGKGKHFFTDEKITYQFALPENIVKARCTSHPHQFDYWVYDEQEQIGEGGFGSLYKIKAKLKIEDNKFIYKTIDNHQLKKRQVIKAQEEKFRGKKEAAITQLFSIFGAKPLIYHENRELNFLILNYLPGKNLVKSYSDSKKENSPLTHNELLSIFIKIGYELKNIAAKGIIHNDLKEDNVMHDRSAKKTTIIDFGISHEEKDVSIISQLTDVEKFLGLIQRINLLERIDEVNKLIYEIEKDIFILQREAYQQRNLKLDPEEVKTLLNKLITGLEQIRFEIKYKDEAKEELALLRTANETAQNVKKILHDYAVNYNYSSAKEEEKDQGTFITKTIIDNLELIQDDPKYFAEFFAVLDMPALSINLAEHNKETLKTAISNKIENITSELHNNLNILLSMLEDVEHYEEIYKKLIKDPEKISFSNLKHELMAVIDRHNSHDNSLDDMKALNTIFQNAINKYKKTLINLKINCHHLKITPEKNSELNASKPTPKVTQYSGNFFQRFLNLFRKSNRSTPSIKNIM